MSYHKRQLSGRRCERANKTNNYRKWGTRKGRGKDSYYQSQKTKPPGHDPEGWDWPQGSFPRCYMQGAARLATFHGVGN